MDLNAVPQKALQCSLIFNSRNIMPLICDTILSFLAYIGFEGDCEWFFFLISNFTVHYFQFFSFRKSFL